MGAINKAMKKVAPDHGDNLSTLEKMSLGRELDGDEVPEVERTR
jgi:hypothetical protein